MLPDSMMSPEQYAYLISEKDERIHVLEEKVSHMCQSMFHLNAKVQLQNEVLSSVSRYAAAFPDSKEKTIIMQIIQAAKETLC